MPASTLNVLVTMRFSEAQLDRLRRVSPDLVVTRADPAEADYSRTDVLYAGAPPRDLGRAPRLRWVQLHMAGVDALADHPLYTASTVPLATASGVHAATVAEYALTVMLALAHRVPRMVAWQRRGGWPPDEQRWPLFVPSEIRGATLGIVGYGSIGRELARMKSSAYLVNVGRGASVDEAALASALRERRLAGAAVDVFGQEPPPAGHPLYALEDVIVSPHVSGFLPSYDDRCTDLFAENLRRYLAGVPLLNVVDRARGH
jgi:phosphoglycerate dehydrogenase-like enzyme